MENQEVNILENKKNDIKKDIIKLLIRHQFVAIILTGIIFLISKTSFVSPQSGFIYFEQIISKAGFLMLILTVFHGMFLIFYIGKNKI